MKTVNFFFLALCAVCALADLNSPNGLELAEEFGFDLTPRIVGGDDAEEGQFPYQVSLRTKLSKQHFCGGSILSSRFILTAAHCTQGVNGKPEYVYAVVGALRRLSGGVVVKLDTITPHENYDQRKFHNDISLLRTADEIVFSNTIQPIALPAQNLPEEGNAEVLLSGWGRTSFPTPVGKPILPDILQFTKPNTLNVDDCKARFKGHQGQNNIHETIVCTINEKNIGACMGDSGGPLVDGKSNPENKTLVGIVSWGVPCGKGYPDVFTSVYSFLDWIGEQIAKQSQDFE